MPFREEPEESVPPYAQGSSQPRYVSDLAAFHIRRSQDQLRMAITHAASEISDMTHVVAQIDIKRHDVIAVRIVKPEAQRLPDSEIPRMMQGDDVVPFRCKLIDDLSATVRASVVDDDDFPTEFVFQRLQVLDESRKMLLEQCLLVEHGHDDGQQRQSILLPR